MNREEALELLKLPLAELVARADRVRRDESDGAMDLCSIMNAKSGMCSEDCKFCAQSSRHSTSVDEYPLKGSDEMVDAAMRAEDIGSRRFGIVTSGNALTDRELDTIAEAIRKIAEKTDIGICASLGKLDAGRLAILKGAGLSRYHHNIETSPGFFPNLTTTHTFQDRVDTIVASKSSALEVCSGGIIGLGEDWSDRIDMAFVLKELDVDSVPINILVPVKGTALETASPASAADIIRAIAIFRIILKDKIIRLAAGRESALKDFQAMAFMAGANGMMIGGYLTTSGRPVEDDRRLVAEIERAWRT